MNHKFLKRQMVIYFAWYFLKNFDDLCRRIVADIAEIIMQRSPWYLKARENKRKQSYLRASNRYLTQVKAVIYRNG